jgi:hypothetical protein
LYVYSSEEAVAALMPLSCDLFNETLVKYFSLWASKLYKVRYHTSSALLLQGKLDEHHFSASKPLATE